MVCTLSVMQCEAQSNKTSPLEWLRGCCRTVCAQCGPFLMFFWRFYLFLEALQFFCPPPHFCLLCIVFEHLTRRELYALCTHRGAP